MRRTTRYAVLAFALTVAAAAALVSARPRTLLERATRVDTYSEPTGLDPFREPVVCFVQPTSVSQPQPARAAHGGVLLWLPDRRVLLWPRGYSLRPRTSTRLKPGRWPKGGTFMAAPCRWQPAAACGAGAHGWVGLVELHDGWHVLRYGADGPHALTDVPAALYPTQRPAAEPMIFIAGSTYGDFPRVALGVTSRGAVLTEPRLWLVNDRGCVLFEHHIGDDASGERRIRLQMPRGGRPLAITLSDQGDRLAWMVYVRARPWAPGWLRRLLPERLMHGRDAVELWVSQSDGTDQHRLAAEALPRGASLYAARGWMVRDPRWTPDGKRVSFLYKDGLYTIPAN